MTPLSVAPVAHRWLATGPTTHACARCHRRRRADGTWRTPSGDPGEGPLPACDQVTSK